MFYTSSFTAAQNVPVLLVEIGEVDHVENSLLQRPQNAVLKLISLSAFGIPGPEKPRYFSSSKLDSLGYMPQASAAVVWIGFHCRPQRTNRLF